MHGKSFTQYISRTSYTFDDDDFIYILKLDILSKCTSGITINDDTWPGDMIFGPIILSNINVQCTNLQNSTKFYLNNWEQFKQLIYALEDCNSNNTVIN